MFEDASRGRRAARVALTLTKILFTATLAAAEVPTPTIEGPVTGGNGTPFVAGTTFDLADVGYMAEEFFISGTATAYASAVPLTADGLWTVTPGDTAAYKTRILVYRPANRAKFSGTVFVEWNNVSGGLDAAPDWIAGHVELIRSGHAWVGVSAQKVGVDGGPPLLPGLPSLPLKTVDPVRYGSLVHPGDSFSYDMFSQAGQVVRSSTGIRPLGDLKLKTVVAIGESQSAFRMVMYVNAVHRLTHVYDGFLIHSRGAGGAFGAPLSESPQPAIPAPPVVRIRTDVDVPVLTLQTETDIVFFGSANARQDDTAQIRLWEVAGTAHADTYTIVTGMTDLGNDPSVADLLITATPGGFFTCPVPINSGPLHFVLNAAISALHRWARRGTPPPSAPRLDIGPGLAVARDTHGNALGGIRTPQLDVPIATYSGGGQSGAIACLLFGSTTPFDAVKLQTLYPTHRAFVSAFRKATTDAVRAGFLLKRDGKLLKKWAAQSDVGS
jgi:hypothetical protein